MLDLDLIDQFIKDNPQKSFWYNLTPANFFEAIKTKDPRALLYLTNSAPNQTPWGLWGLAVLKKQDPEQYLQEYRILVDQAVKSLNEDTYLEMTPLEKNKHFLFNLFEMCETTDQVKEVLAVLGKNEKWSPLVFDLLDKMTPSATEIYFMGALRRALAHAFAMQNSLGEEKFPPPLDWLLCPDALSFDDNLKPKFAQSVFVGAWEMLAKHSDKKFARIALDRLFEYPNNPKVILTKVANVLLASDGEIETRALVAGAKKNIEKNNEQAAFWLSYFAHQRNVKNSDQCLKKIISFCDDTCLSFAIDNIFSSAASFHRRGNHGLDHVDLLDFSEALVPALSKHLQKHALSGCMKVMVEDRKNLKSSFEYMLLSSEIFQDTQKDNQKPPKKKM